MQKIKLLSIVLLSYIVASCSSVPPTSTEADLPGSYKYQAWAPSAKVEYEAINNLLRDADRLINDSAFDEAADKLERVLRIKPDYAPAWSRLSWVTMQSNEPTRSIEMAKRSNSFAQADKQLMLLNWTFIRSASQMTGDDAGYRQADQKIRSLKN